MIKKIKKYRISIRPSYVFRAAKKKLSPGTADEILKKTIEEEISKSQPFISPSALYNTFSKNKTAEALIPLWQLSPKRALSVSFIIVSIGSSIEAEIENSRKKNEELRSVILGAIAQESMEQSLNFIVHLLNEEAKSEGCEPSPALPVEPIYFKDILSVLESNKTEITLNDAGQITPLYSCASFCFWEPVAKSKHAKPA